MSSSGRKLQGITEEVKKQAEQRISSVHDLALKKTQRGRRYGKSAESRKLTRARDYLDSAQKHCGTIVERNPDDEQYRMRMHEPGYPETDMV